MSRSVGRWGAAGLSVALALAARVGDAQVVFDGTLGPDGPAPTRALPALDILRDYEIRYDEAPGPGEVSHGVRLDGNLFHSFAELSVLQPEEVECAAGVAYCHSVTFRAIDGNDDPIALDNVIARVTGGAPSVFEGLLRSEIPGADLYLLNPSGVIFRGPDINHNQNQLDLKGSLILSTADSLRFSDDNDTVFEVADIDGPSLTAADPTSFGFLAGGVGVVAFEGTPNVDPGDGANIVVVASSVDLTKLGARASKLQVAGGEIQIAAVGGAAVEVPLDVADFDAFSMPQMLGEIRVTGTSALRYRGSAGGGIVLRAGRLVVDASTVRGASSSAERGALDIEIADAIEVSQNARLVEETNRSEGPGALIETRHLEVRDNGTRMGLITTSTAERQPFVVATDFLLVTDGGKVSTSNVDDSPGGDLVIAADSIEVRGGGAVLGEAAGAGQKGGSVRVTTRDLLVTGRNADDISRLSMTSRFSQADAEVGDMTIVARSAVVVEEAAQISARSSPTGDGGDLSISTGTLLVRSGGQISTTTVTGHEGGDLSITAAGAIDLVGDGSDPNAPTGIFARSGTGDIPDAGDAGSLTLSGASLEMSGDAIVSTRSFGAGRTGALTIDTVDGVRLAGNTNGTPEISARVDGDGAGDRIAITTGLLELREGAAIASSTFGSGGAGAIEITATDVVIEGRDAQGRRAEILSQSVASLDEPETGPGGSIRLSVADSLELSDRGRISSESSSIGLGDAGDIRITTGGDFRVVDADITAEATAASGGVIEVMAGGHGDVLRSQLATSVLGRDGEGDAGNLTIEASTLVVNQSSLLATATQGFGGNIRIRANPYLESADSIVDASAGDPAKDGEIDVPPPDVALKAALARLPSDFRDATGLLKSQCAARAARGGSFVVSGPEGLAESPARPLSVPIPLPSDDDEPRSDVEPPPAWSLVVLDGCPVDDGGAP